MLHAYDKKFDVTENFENFCELNKAFARQCTAPNSFDPEAASSACCAELYSLPIRRLTESWQQDLESRVC